jgi:hypothetical protein
VLTLHDGERGVRAGDDVANKSQFSIVTCQRSPGRWLAAITPYAHSGIYIRGRTTVSFVTPDDYGSESEAMFAAEKIIKAL